MKYKIAATMIKAEKSERTGSQQGHPGAPDCMKSEMIQPIADFIITSFFENAIAAFIAYQHCKLTNVVFSGSWPDPINKIDRIDMKI
ncbi:MAG: hypothetical protein Q9P90_00870 [candidate division KSB1 bacterium]|nr:hypothetical protein [candidate division KSB1 bacterium]